MPALICGSGAEPAITPIGGCPPSTAATAGPAPLNGMCVMSTLARTLNRFSPVRCGVVPLPAEANASLSVFALASSSASVFAGKSACTTMRFGCEATIASGMKSFSPS